MRRATAEDIPQLVSLMAEFYGEAGYELDPECAARAFAEILADDRLGYIWIIQSENQDVGHVVLTVRFAMEYGGVIACLDDLYVRPGWRNKGLGTGALKDLRTFCKDEGFRAMTVEVGHDNGPAQAAYRRVGFVEAADRQLLTLALASPSHIS